MILMLERVDFPGAQYALEEGKKLRRCVGGELWALQVRFSPQGVEK
jgi:hypothetical protein